jgi:proteic killer suppression protein
VILGYRDKRIRDFAAGKRVKAFSGIERSARLKLDRLEAATSIRDLAALPGNRFEALTGDRKGQYSIRINDLRANDQWRDCVEWAGAMLGPSDVEIVDYH